MTTQIFLVRHGQTAWNTEKVFRGTVDVQLNDQGFAEAEAVGKALEGEPISFIYSSPLSRAIQTGTPLAKIKGLEIVEHDGFTDMNFGEWQGRKLEDVERTDAELFKTWIESPAEVRIPGGEMLDDIQKRALDAWWEIVEKHPGETGMVVSHRVICKLLVLGLLKLGPDMFWNLQQDTAAINLFAMKDGRAIACRINDICHLSSLNEGRVTADF